MVRLFAWFGIPPATVSAQHLSQWVGLFEVALGLAVVIKPFRELLVFMLVWKLGTELLRPLVGQINYQFVERAGDYALPMALILIEGWLLNRRGVAKPRHVAPAKPVAAVAA